MKTWIVYDNLTKNFELFFTIVQNNTFAMYLRIQSLYAYDYGLLYYLTHMWPDSFLCQILSYSL